MQLLLRHLICFICFLSLSCSTISSDIKHSEWMQIKEERTKEKNPDNAINISCSFFNYAGNNSDFTEDTTPYCNEIRKSFEYHRSILDRFNLHELHVKVENFPFTDPSTFENAAYAGLVFPAIYKNSRVVVSWYEKSEVASDHRPIFQKDLYFDRYEWLWFIVGLWEYDLIKRMYEDRWYKGESFAYNLGGHYYRTEFAIILNRRMIQDVLDGKVALIRQSN